MKMQEYQEKASKFAIYPDRLNRSSYPYIGLIGEYGEFCDKYKKIIRDNNSIIDDNCKKNLIMELGDIFWYVSEICTIRGIDFKDNILDAIDGKVEVFTTRRKRYLEEFKRCENVVEISYNEVIFGIIYGLHNLSCMFYRIESNCNTDVEFALQEFVATILFLLSKFEIPLIVVLQENINKLESRFLRDKIKGSGDDR